MTQVIPSPGEDTAESKCIHANTPYQALAINLNRQVTLSPTLVDEAWANLSLNTRAVSYHSLPQLMHASLLRTLRLSKKLASTID